MNHVPSGHTVAVPSLLSRAAKELTLCVQMLLRVEALVVPAMNRGDNTRDESSGGKARLAAMQDIDLLCQRLADMSLCLSSLATAPALRRADHVDIGIALGRLQLADLRARLAGQPTAPRNANEPIELFEP